jgi:4-amino-4-deoxy-L-arabinose transferase-like glycosyltransferase
MILLAVVSRDRGAEYDEGYTVFLASGDPRPDWPAMPFRAGDVRGVFDGRSTFSAIARDLRATDVHPPLYFWAAEAWRRLVGPDLFALRLLSVLFGTGALLAVALLAAEADVPAVPAMLLALGCYGFSYTAAVARGFALAEVLALSGVWLVLRAGRRGLAPPALAGGLLLGLAGFTNYLAAFLGAAALLWLLLRLRRGWRAFAAAAVGFAAVLPGDLWFFLAQRGSRAGQFPPFHLLPSLARLAQYAAGAIFGGLPLYAEGRVRLLLGALLAALLVTLVGLIGVQWRRIGRPDARLLLALGAVAPPVGLIALGIVFDTTPIELRYLAYAAPFFALLLAGALAALPSVGGAAVLVPVLAIQAAALAGLAARPETMQPQAAATREAAALAGRDGLVLVPRGNDGVGVVGAVIQSAPDWLRLLVVPRAATPEAIRARAGRPPVVVLALLGLDADSRATLPAMAAAFRDQPCWQESGHGADTLAFTRAPDCAPSAAAR